MASMPMCVAATGSESEDSEGSFHLNPVRADLQLDWRAYIPIRRRGTSRLHSTFVSVQTSEEAAPYRLTVQLMGMDQYGAFRWQQAALSAELAPARGHRLPQRLQLGIVRLPFGIYDYRETYNSGLIDYPMPRVDYAFSAVDWGVPGAQWTGGSDRWQVEAARFNGNGAGVWSNLNGVDGTALRVQTFAPPGLVVGVSGWQGRQAAFPGQSERKPVRLIGADWRWARPYLLVRGEVLAGTLAGDPMRGAYLDLYYRLPDRVRWTLVARGEFLKPTSVAPTARQITLGGRWNVDADLSLALNWRRNNMDRAYGFTWTTVSGTRGEFLFQLLRRITVH
ncbi:MAG: hypothetical protein SFU56_06255 [Capsulimonadales bacterium]|nr:hypothetical protein [Capsulimonadales bacterium]